MYNVKIDLRIESFTYKRFKTVKKLQRLTAKIYFLNVSAYTVAQSHTATSTTSEVLT